jgi:DNA-binding winged helix-turn-helix (wHTH) protein/predicted ATPase
MIQKRQILFPPFRLDPINQYLLRDQEVIPLRPKTFAVLQYLAERPNRLVKKEELIEAVWPETYVTDTLLKGCVTEIRKALGDDPAVPRFIETAHRLGYRFIAPITLIPEDGGAGHQIKSSGRFVVPLRLRLPPASGLVGRETGFAQLERQLERAMEGERQVVFITGEVGIGKTAMVDSFLQRVARLPEIWLAQGQCLEQYGAGEAYLPVLEAVSRLCQEPGRERLLELLRRRAPSWLRQMPWLASVDEVEEFKRDATGATRERMLREMAETIEALTDKTPLVLALEDLHWSDYSTLDLISYLARRSERARLLLIGTYRPVEVILQEHPLKGVKQELRAKRLCEELSLERLSEESVGEYLSSRFQRSPLPIELAKLIHQRTEGNPLFMVSAVDYLQAEGLIVESAGRWRMQVELAETEVGVPESIRQMIEKQIDRLSRDQRRALEAASVAGTEFSSAAVAAGLEEDLIRTEEMCEELARRHQFLEAAGVGELPDGNVTSRYRFIHSLYQNVLYDRTATAHRARLHRRIAERGEAVFGERAGEIAAELAMHFEQGRDYWRAVKYLRQAAENDIRRSANREAVAIARRGLELIELLPDTTERAREELNLLAPMGVALIVTMGYGAAEVERVYARARELCRRIGETPHLFRALWGLERFYSVRGPLPAAREIAEQLLRLADQAQDVELSLQAHNSMAASLFYLGEFALALEHLELAIAIYDPQRHRSHAFLYGMDPGVANLSRASLALWILGYPERALGRSREAMALARDLSHPFSLAYALNFAAVLHHYRREPQPAQELIQTSIGVASEHGLRMIAMLGAVLLAGIIAEDDPTRESLTRLRESIEACRAIGTELFWPYALCMTAKALLKAGRIAEGLAAIEEAMAVIDRTSERFYEAELHRVKGELLLQSGAQDPQSEAASCFRHAITLSKRQQARAWELRAATSLARLYQSQGAEPVARQTLAEVYGFFTEGFDAADLTEAHALLSEI